MFFFSRRPCAVRLNDRFPTGDAAPDKLSVQRADRELRPKGGCDAASRAARCKGALANKGATS